ncbi:phosphate ABC transporter substrate-binding protein (PhoT family) [Rhodopseudomonas thermotolerans]|uniref:Phosphate-binding protein PstS n=2 Tax=Rhodopseudomonas TaxID=1073 RepID=A0A336JQN7_9BRAD|nr:MULTISPECIES: phosphate ABC transporter substrate-binding protein PstS [Rhodopseudomonas]RED31912.1 phosphate ABC transporter substrate-binding protein (PhoT family) [Rhodopseudomonas pentothenatexigens]REF93213.1 phosphate ABC transporter substrate-binding protein (PhoT family) [Rhodopseudomonas thermotolerans]SSW91892.1 phosphate ABC transporter substrate-binding protein (PhoT family) [Rhodopseudomonas pentothenatexigens]
MRAIRFALMALAISSAGVTAGRAEMSVMGTGSAFAAPIYIKWAEQQKPTTGLAINYQPSGSSVGQLQVLRGLTDFGGSDVPMDDNKLKEGNIRQFPTIVGGYAVVVNIPGVSAGKLRLTAPVLADIFMGVVKSWDDVRIVQLNPGLALPSLPISLLYHAGGSGGTYAISRYLSKNSAAWRDRMGIGMTLSWPVGAGVKGSYGAASTVPMTPGGIGYAELSYVTANNLATVQLQNRAGRFVMPNGRSFADAAEHGDWSVPNFAVDLTDMPGEHAWPIVTATFALVPRSPDKRATSAAALEFFKWAFAHGDATARSMQFVPLPSKVKADIVTTLMN